jgi:3-oxoacyl-(acyl-carrier-protein) synthase
MCRISHVSGSAMSNSFGLGGHNATVVFRAVDLSSEVQ